MSRQRKDKDPEAIPVMDEEPVVENQELDQPVEKLKSFGTVAVH